MELSSQLHNNATQKLSQNFQASLYCRSFSQSNFDWRSSRANSFAVQVRTRT